MSSTTWVRWVVAISAVLAGCTGDEPANVRTVQIDTVGSVIFVRNAMAAAHDTLHPYVTIGSAADSESGAPDEFGRINSVVLDSSGTLYVADGHALEVRVFSPTGEFRRAFGRSGEGPGEFRSLQSLAMLGDTLLALDGGNARINLLTRSGEPLTSWQWLPFTGPANTVRFYPTGPREISVLGWDGIIRLSQTGPADTVSHPVPDDLPSTMLRCPRSDGGISFFQIPFAARRIAVAAPGGRQASAWSADYAIAITSENGDTIRLIQRDYTPLPITDREWEAATVEFRTFQVEWPGERCDPGNMSRPSSKAALQGIYFDHDGRMVVEVTADRMTRYDFYDAEGRAGVTVYVPMRSPDVVPYFVGERFAQVAADSLDVQSVQIFRADLLGRD